jgi:hypothetical protein
MRTIRSKLTYSNVVSTLCLFVLLGGGAYAAVKVPNNSVGTKQLRNNAVKGPKVADDSLTAADIKGPEDSATTATEATHAANADRAANADQAARAAVATNAEQLGGATASSFLPSSSVRRADLSVVQAGEGAHVDPLLSMSPLTLTTKCVRGPTEIALGVYASTSASNATFGWGYTRSDNVATAEFTSINTTPNNVLTFNDNALGEVGAGEVVYRDPNTTITMTFQYFVSDLFNECRLHGVAVHA